jgi:hypothetical protein
MTDQTTSTANHDDDLPTEAEMLECAEEPTAAEWEIIHTNLSKS